MHQHLCYLTLAQPMMDVPVRECHVFRYGEQTIWSTCPHPSERQKRHNRISGSYDNSYITNSVTSARQNKLVLQTCVTWNNWYSWCYNVFMFNVSQKVRDYLKSVLHYEAQFNERLLPQYLCFDLFKNVIDFDYFNWSLMISKDKLKDWLKISVTPYCQGF